MGLQEIKAQLQSKSILFSEDPINHTPSVIGYDKKFKWTWFATQLNTFIVAVDLGAETVSIKTIEDYLTASFQYAKTHYTGWPRGLQAGLGVIVILISENIDDAAIRYCQELKSGKKWAGFSIPVAVDSSKNQVYAFDKNPLWGKIYYPYFKALIQAVLA